jgi:hypothetical protein
MTTMLAAPPLLMTDEQRDELECVARLYSLPHRTVVQAKALLLAADGEANYEIARRLHVASNSVRTWRRRFEESGTSWVGKVAKGRGRRSWLNRPGNCAEPPSNPGRFNVHQSDASGGKVSVLGRRTPSL